MITFLIFISILSLLILVHEFGHLIAAKRAGVRVEKFSLGFGPRLFSKTKGHTQYSLNAIPLGGFVKLSGDSLEEYKGRSHEYFAKPIRARLKIIFWGPLLNYISGFLCFWLILFIGYPTLTTKVGGLIDGFGAQEAGLQIGDKITAVDNQKVMFWEELQKIIHSKKSAVKVSLSVLRGDREERVEVRIKEKQFSDPIGRKRNVGLLGITPFDEIIKVRHGFIQSLFLAINKTYDLTIMTYEGLWRMVTGQLSMRESVTGPLGIFYITSKVASMGIVAVLHLVAVLNISLALFNLLPLPVLDGGHILLLGLEKIRGRTLTAKTEHAIAQLGMMLMLSLALLVTYNDFLRIFGDKVFK